MRQKLYILTTFGLLLGAILLTACQADGLPFGLEQGYDQPAVSSTDSCFINLLIVNTSQPTTRATAAEENAIYDGILCILKGNSESSATLQSAVVIDQLINNPGTLGSVDVVQRLPVGTHPYPASGSGKLYVLALLNTSATGLTVNNDMLYLNGSSLSGYTRAQLQSLEVNSVGTPDKHVGLFMASKPKGAGSSTPEQTAIQIYDPASVSQYLYDNQSDITPSSHRLTLNVERAAARVRVTNAIPPATALQNITLLGGMTTHPLIHQIRWTINKYNRGAYAIGGGSASTGTPDNKFAAKDFTYFHEHALKSGDAVYIGPNNNTDSDNTTEDDDKTEVIVEVQLKDGSFLLGDCFAFKDWDNNMLFTTVETLKEYYKNGWDSQKGNYTAISTKTAEAVFRNLKVVIDSNDQVEVTLTNSDFTATEQEALNSLASVLSEMTTCFRDGKMYYTFTLDELQRNNAYNLSLVEEAATDTRQVTATFKFDQGSSSATATFSNSTASLFASSSITIGSNLTITGTDTTLGQTKIQPSEQHKPATEADNIDFLIDPVDGWMFTPSSVSFNTTRYGTDGGALDISWINSGGASTVPLETGVTPLRNNATPNVLNWSHVVTSATAGDGNCGLRIKLYALSTSKQVGLSDIAITGTLSKSSGIADLKKSISGVGRATP